MNIKEAIRYGIEKLNKNNIDEANLKIKMLLSYILGKTKEYFVIHGDESLSLDDELKFKEGINKLNNKNPNRVGIHIGKIKDGDIIVIDIPNRTINVKLSDEELKSRPQQPLKRKRVISKALRAYAQSVSSADKGGVRIID